MRKMVIQIRGTSGSGKTYIIYRLMSKYKFKSINQGSSIVGYYCKELNLFIVGKYETACGGCDSINTQDEICNRILKATKRGWNVLFEGLICSHIAKRYAELYFRLQKNNIESMFIFLNTPFDTCVENINIRREKAGKTRVQAKNTLKDYTSTHKSRENMNSMGVPESNTPVLSGKETYKLIIKLLKEE